MNNPDGLDQAIAQDPELSALRDANPLCAELMSDVETMKILVDPDNLRALADCPNLIALDFTNPSWSPQDIETGIFDDLANAGSSSNNNNASFSDSYNRGQQLTNSLSKSRGNEDGGSRLGLMVSSLSLGIADYIATQTIGSTVNDFVGGGNNFGAPAIVDGAIAAADTTEACMDNLESNIADEGGSKAKSVDRVKAANSNVPFGELGVADESGADNDETKKGSFRQVSRAAGGSLAALSAVAKEQVVFTLLGNDLGDVYLNKMERGNEDKEDGEQAEEGNDKSKPSLFRRKKPG